MRRISKRLIIFEGPDGVGKTTIAKKMAELFGMHYVHVGAFPNCRDISRFYVEAMMPAVLGHADVVMDRCWLSDPIYGFAYRDGLDRVGVANKRILERLAARCQTTIIRCTAGWDEIVETFSGRRDVELLDDITQLKNVYDLYHNDFSSSLPIVVFQPRQYTPDEAARLVLRKTTTSHTIAHFASAGTAGNLLGKAILVCDDSGRLHEPCDSLYQWPYCDLSGLGTSAWLTMKLESAGISEADLLWVNYDRLSEKIATTSPRIIALGDLPKEALLRFGCSNFDTVKYPDEARISGEDEYELITVLKEKLNVCSR